MVGAGSLGLLAAVIAWVAGGLPEAAIAFVMGAAVGIFVEGAARDVLLPDRAPAGPSVPPPAGRGELPPNTAAKVTALARVFASVARADGPMSDEERDVAVAYFNGNLGLGAAMVARATRALSAPEPMDTGAAILEARGFLSPKERPPLLSALYAMALVDGPLQNAEHDALKRVSAALNLPDAAYAQVAERHLGSGEEHYAVLGVAHDASDDDIRAAYRKLAARYHPDRAAQNGIPKEEAAAEFLRVKSAWESLKKLRGL